MKDSVQFLIESVALAESLGSKLDEYDFLSLPGMSGKKNRSLLNILCSRPGTRYLEAGVWRGATFCSALKGNSVRAFAYDNWTEFTGPVMPPSIKIDATKSVREEFYYNLGRYIGSNDVSVVECDIFGSTGLASIVDDPIDVYLYDANHTEESQEKAITALAPWLADEAIVIIDDYTWEEVRRGTESGIKKSGLVVIHDELLGVTAQRNPEVWEGWWSGWRAMVVKRSDV